MQCRRSDRSTQRRPPGAAQRNSCVAGRIRRIEIDATYQPVRGGGGEFQRPDPRAVAAWRPSMTNFSSISLMADTREAFRAATIAHLQLGLASARRGRSPRTLRAPRRHDSSWPLPRLRIQPDHPVRFQAAHPGSASARLLPRCPASAESESLCAAERLEHAHLLGEKPRQAAVEGDQRPFLAVLDAATMGATAASGRRRSAAEILVEVIAGAEDELAGAAAQCDAERLGVWQSRPRLVSTRTVPVSISAKRGCTTASPATSRIAAGGRAYWRHRTTGRRPQDAGALPANIMVAPGRRRGGCRKPGRGAMASSGQAASRAPPITSETSILPAALPCRGWRPAPCARPARLTASQASPARSQARADGRRLRIAFAGGLEHASAEYLAARGHRGRRKGASDRGTIVANIAAHAMDAGERRATEKATRRSAGVADERCLDGLGRGRHRRDHAGETLPRRRQAVADRRCRAVFCAAAR